MNQLESMTEGKYRPPETKVMLTQKIEERHIRERFNNEHGAHLPEDICLCIRNTPTRWEVVPQRGEDWEVLPELAQDFITQVTPLLVLDVFSAD